MKEVLNSEMYIVGLMVKTMKKFIGWSILIVVLAVIGIALVIVIDSRTYFKQYFEKQRTELNLRSEKSALNGAGQQFRIPRIVYSRHLPTGLA